MIKRDSYLAVDGQELTRHVLILVTEDDLDLVSPGGHHWGEVISANVDSSEEFSKMKHIKSINFSPLLIVEEDRAHPRRDSPDHTDLATQPSVLMTVLDENLNRQDVIMVTSA